MLVNLGRCTFMGQSIPSNFNSRRWHAVSVLTTPASCPMARALGTTRFLAQEAPRLPMPDCRGGDSCPCGYKHHADRRGQARRAEELTGLRRPHPGTDERRQQRGRRSTDL